MPSWYLNRKEDMKFIGITIMEVADEDELDTDSLEGSIQDIVMEDVENAVTVIIPTTSDLELPQLKDHIAGLLQHEV